MAVIRWEEPTYIPNQRGAGWTNEVLTELISRPNEWAVVSEGVVSTPGEKAKFHNKASNLKTVASRRGLRVEAHYRYTPEDSTVRIYARFIKEVS